MATLRVVIETCIVCVILLISVPVTISMSQTEALLKLKQSFTNPQALDSWKIGTDPCDKVNRWIGVTCQNQNVTAILLGAMSLSGTIDVDALAQLPAIRTISFRSNLFSGPIPEFHRIGVLKGLYLQSNQFSGEIPSNYFEKMESLKKIWISGNRFTGEIPSSVTLLRYLIELHVEDNQFSGTIPALNQSTLKSVDVANNNLTGEIPVTLTRFNMSNFKGNPGLCSEKLGKPCSQATAPAPAPVPVPVNNNNNTRNENGHSNKSKSIAIWVMVASLVLLLIMIVAIYIMCRKQRDRGDGFEKQGFAEPSLGRAISSDSKKSFELSRKGSSIRRGSSTGKKMGDLTMVNDDKGEFGLADLMKAAAEVLGNGSLGSSYKAMMSNGLTVVVKRIKEMNKIGKEGFDAEVRRLGKLRHKNVLPLLAYHYRKEEKLFVFEYVPKGSLLFLLHGDRGIPHAELTWPVRLKIIQGIVQGLSYLHTELSSSDLPHGDLKSSNILISAKNEPILTGYGVYALINSTHASQALIAYKSPEAVQNQQVSPKCDVYCLGVVILEILTGKFPAEYLSNGKGGIDIVQWVKSAVAEGRENELFDPDIAREKNSTGQMKEMLRVGAECVESNPQQRISLKDVISRIDEIQQQPPQPQQPPQQPKQQQPQQQQQQQQPQLQLQQPPQPQQPPQQPKQQQQPQHIQIMPSLRDGCAEIPVQQSPQEPPIN